METLIDNIYVPLLLFAFLMLVGIQIAQRLGEARANLISAVATALLALAATGLAFMGYRQLNEMRTDRRAWVGPLVGKLLQPLTFNTAADIVISLQNTGREPATNVAYYPQITMPYVSEDRSGALQRNIDAFVSMCFSGKAPTSPEGKVLYPTMPFAAADELRASFPGNQIDWDVIYGTKILLVENCVAYETSGETRHSSFCYYYWNGVSPDSQVNDCGKGSARAN